MKNLILISFLLVVYITNAQSKFTILNKNSRTTGIIKMQFEVYSSDRVYVRIWAKCNSNDCF